MSFIDNAELFSLSNILLFGGMALLLIILIVIIISFSVTMSKTKKEVDELSDSSNSLRVFIIDADHDNVRYFNRSRLEKRKTSTITEFYNQFPAGERDKIITWIANLLDDVPDTPKYLEINVLFKYNRKSYFSILQLTKVDHEKRTIYLESFILKYMYAKKSKKNGVQKFSYRDKFTNIVNSNHTNKGVTFAINFFDKRTHKNEISHLVFAQIKNIVIQYITPYRPMIIPSDNQIIISDLKISLRANIVAFVNTMKNEINKLLMISALEDEVGFTFGIAENKFFYNEVDKLIETVIDLANIAKDDEKSFIIYEQGRKIEVDSDNLRLRTEVERIIDEKKIRYTYRPIYDVERGRTVGYQAFFEPIDSFFETIEEFKAYALRTEDDKELFTTISRNSITRFIQEKDGISLRLFFPINVTEMKYVNWTFAHILSIKDANIVLILNEDEILELPKESTDTLIDTIKTFKSKGYEVALLLNDNETALPSSTYEVFDYYLLSVASHIKGSKSQNRQLPSFQALVEKLLRYNKPIIAIDIPTMSLVEYIIKLGVQIVSSDAIAPRDENVLPINSKIIAKLKDMN